MATQTFSAPGARNTTVNSKVPVAPKAPSKSNSHSNKGGGSTSGAAALKSGVINPMVKV